ncbi:carboxypeptidase-like regulatory domain-containing protein [Flavobacterium tiangeerense]|nr:carboxypeptidase-like regulatory domain-containing protein [Flavobacterium tiangeerense]
MKESKNILFCLVLFITSNSIYCQTTIFGYSRNSESKIALNSSVILKNINSKEILVFSNTNEKGYYELKTNKTGKFTLTFSTLNYDTQTIEIEITSETKIIEKNIFLAFKPVELREIIIKKEKPITIKKDTIVFNAKSFLQGNEQVVEDLLKKIPGLSIDQNGTIKVGNQEIEKVMIDGDDFFEKGYKLITKNMPVNTIEKVELYQHYSNNKLLKGIEKSDKVALNLKLKDNFKRQWFGNFISGYGLASENRYEIRSNLMNFGKKNKHYFITNLNNTGNNATGDIDNLIRPFRFDDIETIGDDQNVNTIISLESELPNLKQSRVNFNNAEMLSLNSIFTISPKTKLKTLSFLNTDENYFLKNSFQSYSVGNTSFVNTENFIGRKIQITGFGKIDLIYDVTKTKTLEYSGKFNSTNEKNRSNLNFNGDLLNEKLKSNNQLFDQKIVFTNKYKNNQVLLFIGRYIAEKTPQNYSVNQFLYQDLFLQNANNIAQNSENKMQFAGFDVHLLDRKKNGDLLEIQFGNQFRTDILISNFQLKNDDNIVSEPLEYQNNINYNTNDLYLNTKYRFKLKKISVLSQASFHQLFNKFKSLIYSQTQTPFFINPKLGLEWEINAKNKVLTSYSLNKTNATIQDVYNNYIQTGFRSFSKGTGNFNQLNTSSVLLNYIYGNWGDKFFANSSIVFAKDYDFFSTNTIIEQNYAQSEKILIKNRELLTFSSNIDRYLKSMSSNLKLTFGGSKSNFKNIVNNSDPREINIKSLNYGVELRSGFRGIFNYHLGTKWDYSEVKTSFTNSFINNLTFLDLFFIMNDKLNFQIQSERYFFGNLDKNNNKYYFMDLEARYTVKENKLTFSLSGNNLFNTKTFRSFNINDISISKTEYRLQPRYGLLKMEYRF